MRNAARVCALVAFVFSVLSVQTVWADGVLFMGTDTFAFAGSPSELAKVTVTGDTAGTLTILNPDFYVNGLAEGPGFLYAGDPGSNILRTIDYSANLLTAVTAGFPNERFNEDMTFDGTDLWHAHWCFPSVTGAPCGNIQKLDPATGAVLTTYDQGDTVGMALIAGTFWISHWNGRQVGTWDPTTNAFVSVFSTPSNAGGLAFDTNTGILWVGLQGGSVVPYNLAGTALNGGFKPYGDIPDTIDGLALVPVPEPGSVLLLGIGGVTLLVGRLRRRKQQ